MDADPPAQGVKIARRITNLVCYFDSATRPNTFWVSLTKLNLKPGTPAKNLTIQNGEVFSGEVADQFKDAPPFKFLPASPPVVAN